MKKIDRNLLVNRLISLSPILLKATCADDMGWEFSALVPGGAIYSQPGMLLSYSEGNWPPNSWSKKLFKKNMNEFLLRSDWVITPWSELSDEELYSFLEEIEELEN